MPFTGNVFSFPCPKTLICASLPFKDSTLIVTTSAGITENVYFFPFERLIVSSFVIVPSGSDLSADKLPSIFPCIFKITLPELTFMLFFAAVCEPALFECRQEIFKNRGIIRKTKKIFLRVIVILAARHN